MAEVRVHVKTLANSSAIRKEKRSGRDVIVLPSSTLPDNVVMNGIRYPAEEIEKAYRSLERTPAPLGHPKLEGRFVSARDPEGINMGWVGAWNENVRRENGRVFLDKVIDVARANESEGGRSLLAAIEKMEPIHTSTGLFCELVPTTNDSDAKHIASSIVFDHDAILLNEEGAATPEQGVGIFVNSAGEQVEVINSALDEAERELDWAVDSLARAIERRERSSALDQMKSAILSLFGERKGETVEGNEMTVTKEQFEGLSAQVNTLAEELKTVVGAIPGAVETALQPILEAQAQAVANAKVEEARETSELVTKVVAANLLDEETAKATPLATLRALANNATLRPAAPLLNTAPQQAGVTSQYKLPKGTK